LNFLYFSPRARFGAWDNKSEVLYALLLEAIPLTATKFNAYDCR